MAIAELDCSSYCPPRSWKTFLIDNVDVAFNDISNLLLLVERRCHTVHIFSQAVKCIRFAPVWKKVQLVKTLSLIIWKARVYM